MKELFNRIYADAGNDLNLQEVHLFFKSITDDISEENIDKIFSNLDSNGDKSIYFNEFTVKINLSNYILILLLLPQNLFNEISVAGWKQVEKIERQDIKEDEVQALFNMIDMDKSGFLTMKVMLVICYKLSCNKP